MRPTLILLLIMLAACGKAPEPRSPTMSNASPLHAIPDDLEKQLAFTCSYEAKRIPKRDPETDQLFLHARWLYKQNLLKDDPAKYPAVERLYRIAAASGHDKANRNLTLMMLRGQTDAPDIIGLPLALAQDMIKRGVPAGYYDMGVLLTKGYGVKGDDASALQYMRHAADLGHPDAQYHVGELLNSLTITYPIPFGIGYEMKKCAAEQGHAKAANEYAVHLQDKENYPEALKYYQMAVKAGNSTAALSLEDGFLAPPPDNRLDYLALPKDEERSQRYKILRKFLHNYSYLNPTVDDIDDIVPLPPAKLPPWDGKTRWQKAWDSGETPPLPSEDRIAELARAKGLDPATGRPLPTKAQP